MPKDKFPVMLASPMKELHRISFPCLAQTKMDGMRALIVVENSQITVYSRVGKKMMKLDQHFKSIVYHDNMVYDGELTVVNEKGETMNRQTGNGICHKAVESVNTITDEEVSRIRITLWDIIPLKAWKEGIDTTPYHLRLGEIDRIPEHRLFKMVETYKVNSMEDAQDLFNKMLDRGEEGIILKHDDHPWENKRSKHCVKMKAELEMDLKITGFIEGKGKNAGMLGALTCESKDGKIQVDVGTGFNDERRISIWNNRDKLLNTIVSVKYNELIKSKTDKPMSLSLPVFVELRPDKDVAD